MVVCFTAFQPLLSYLMPKTFFHGFICFKYLFNQEFTVTLKDKMSTLATII